MKRFAIATLVLVLGAAGMARAYSPEVTQELDRALEDVRKDLASASIDKSKTIAVVAPLLKGDQSGFLAGRLKPTMKDAGLKVVEHLEAEFAEQIKKELANNERWNDLGILDKSTLILIGENLKNAEYLIYGSVREPEVSDRRIYVEMELHIASIKTAEYIWGGVFTKTKRILSDDQERMVRMDRFVSVEREVMRESFADLAAVLKAKDELKGKRIAITPIRGGDELDALALDCTKETMTQAGLKPIEIGARSFAEAYMQVHDKPEQADAILRGAVRARMLELVEDGFRTKTYSIGTEAFVEILDKDGVSLCSKSVVGKKPYVRTLTLWELFQMHKKESVIGAMVLVGLIVIGMFLKATRRVR